jgi:SAM-dependent methyltransferase
VLGDYYDALWELTPDGEPAPAQLAAWVAALGPADRALDLGCGDGRLTTALAARELTAADVSLVALKRLRRRVPAATAIVLGADRALPFPDSAFDLVLCADSLEHMLDLPRALSEIRRVLAPGGRLAVATPELGRRTGLALLRGASDPRFDPVGPPRRHFTRDSLRHVLELAGLHLGEPRSVAGRLVGVAEP